MNLKENTVTTITSDEIFKQILGRIISLKLEPGQLISENQMSKEYGVSRSVIRTAFTRLRQLGFIEIYPQRGTYISLIDLRHISDLLVLRTAVEKEVLYEIFRFLGEEGRSLLIKRLEENMREQEKCSDEQDYFGRFPSIDSEFHKIMIDSVERSAMMRMLDDIMLHMARWRNFDVAFDNRIPRLILEHRAIVDAIKSGDLYAAQERMGEHLETITDIAERAVAKYPMWFKADHLESIIMAEGGRIGKYPTYFRNT